METQTAVALYARVSPRDKGEDLVNQMTRLHEVCEKTGLVIRHEYIDRDPAKDAEQ
jgi:predicted site-specific integrase-resolvase